MNETNVQIEKNCFGKMCNVDSIMMHPFFCDKSLNEDNEKTCL